MLFTSGRNTQRVTLFRIDESEKIVSVAHLREPEEEVAINEDEELFFKERYFAHLRLDKDNFCR